MSDQPATAYNWNSGEAPHSCAYISPEIISILSNLEAHRVLDLGAGNGQLCAEIMSHGYQVVGVELSQQGVDLARSNNPDIAFYCYGVEDNPEHLLQRENRFDVVVSTEVIEHLYSPHLLVSYAHHVLEARGYLVLSTPYHGYLKNLALSLSNKWDGHFTALWHGGHIKFWSRKTLSTLLQESGFEVISFSGAGRIPYLWKSMILVARRL